jgi:hypothetical protein
LLTVLHAARLAGIALVLTADPAREVGGRQFVPTGRATLRGLAGVEVLVEALQPELERAGLTGASLRADIVSRIRAHGITVYASQSENPSPAKPYLYLDLNAIALPRGEVAVLVQLHLRQTLRSPATGADVVDAMTWDQHSIIRMPAGSPGTARATVRAQVDQFIEDWVAVHE